MVQQQQNQIQQQQPKLGIAALKSVLNNDAIKQKFADMLGKESQGFITSVIAVCSNNQLLAKADANSIVLAASLAAGMKLPINPNLGYAAIVPFRDGKTGITTGTMQIMRNGWVELALRTGKVAKITNELVYEGELVSKNRFTDEYVFDETKRVSDKVIGAMAYVKLTKEMGGLEKTVYWTTEQCLKHGKRYSQTFRKGYGLWVSDPESMFLKSVLKHLIVKYVPKSIELQKAIDSDQAAFTGDIDNPKPVYVDNPQNDEVGEAVDFEEVDTESGEVQQQEEPKTVIVVEEDEPNNNGELFTDEQQKQ